MPCPLTLYCLYKKTEPFKLKLVTTYCSNLTTLTASI